MMEPHEILAAVVDWGTSLVPEFNASYSYIPASKGNLPDFVAENDGMELTTGDARIPFSQLQNVLMELHTLGLSMMAENDDPAQAAAFLRASAHKMLMSVVQDYTLGGRVPFASPVGFRWDFTRPFIEYMDGTKAREVTGTLLIGVPIETGDEWP